MKRYPRARAGRLVEEDAAAPLVREDEARAEEFVCTLLRKLTALRPVPEFLNWPLSINFAVHFKLFMKMFGTRSKFLVARLPWYLLLRSFVFLFLVFPFSLRFAP